MAVKHLIEWDFDRYMRNPSMQKYDAVAAHLSECQQCRAEFERYQAVANMFTRVDIFEPDAQMLCNVMDELPDIYARKPKPLLEVIAMSIFSIAAFCIFIFLVNPQLNLGASVNQSFSTLLKQLLNSFVSIKFLRQNFSVLAIFVVNVPLFMLIDHFVIMKILQRGSSSISKKKKD